MTNKLKIQPKGLASIFLMAAMIGFSVMARTQQVAEQSQQKPAEIFQQAHAWLKTADSFFNQSMNNEAFEAYLDAFTQYTRLAKEHPKWHPDVIDFRINYCRRQLDRILSGSPRGTDDSPQDKEWVGIKWSSELLEQTPDVLPTGFEKTLKSAAVHEKTADFETALKLYEHALTLDKTSLAAAHGAARCCLELGQINRGREHLLTIFAHDPDNLDTLLLLASMACAERDYNRALRALAPALEQHGGNARLRFMLGSTQMAIGHLEIAEEELLKAIELDPKFSEAHYNLARLLLLRNPTDLIGAREHYERSLQTGGAPDQHLERLFVAPAEQPKSASKRK